MPERQKGGERRKYVYPPTGEAFYVTHTDCEIQVTDGTKIVTIKPQATIDYAAYFCSGPNFHWNGTAKETPEAAIDAACEAMTKARQTPPDLCPDLEEFFDSLDID